MVSASRIEGGNGTQNLSAGVRRTIQSIKEIVGNHSDADIYVTLKETNMDPNETAQKLLNQDTFHEVKRKRDKKKEVTSFKEIVPIKPRKPTEYRVQGMKPNTYTDDSSFQRTGFVRNHVSDAVRSRQFRVVRDNRFNQNVNRNIKPPVKKSVHVTTKEPLTSTTSQTSCSEASETLKSPVNAPIDSNVAPPVQVATKPHDSVTSPNSSVIGVYSSFSDPVHIPSLASRPPANVGAIKREVGPVGVRRHAQSETSAKLVSTQATKDQPSQSHVAESVPSVSSGRSFNNQYNSRPHQKALHANKEWKPKSSQKLGGIGTPKTPTSPAKSSRDLVTEASQLQNKVHNQEDQNVIIAAHIRVSEVDRSRLTFGSLGIESDASQSSGFQEASHAEESRDEPFASLSSSPESSIAEPSGSKQVESVDDRVHGSGSGTETEPQPTDKPESSGPQNMDNYTNIGLDRHSSPSYGPSEVPSCSGYDILYIRPATDESLRGQGLQIPQEINSHAASIPATTIPMVQQQQQQQASVAQMYPQVHLPHYANIMPYRQFISPMYVPPMVMPGYSNNPTYSPHPSTAGSYLLMPGASSAHVTANGLKYAIPQYKSVQAGSPTGYALNIPGIVGSGSGLDDSSRIKYKEGNVYVPNPQGETSEHWTNPRDISSMQSGSYYNMVGQSPHATYLPSQTGQSSHMRFPGFYHPPQPANSHHMGPAISGNVGVGVAAGGQGGGYQQQQPPQLSWSGNF